ncbi:sialidase family protein [Burkholderia diffusa]|uniref:sialidase family protein n=1 Tax=Burkholderia diffusa TaxID=488732 RepID=UPI00075508EE|nr:sialidase family protein [Burkholderia diffusa]KVC45508.1 hypothetical protein WI71_14530 [Burkholderia diffusa]KVG26498.1 hypothetical protein WJ30_27800 [Burkholderia diffusa]
MTRLTLVVQTKRAAAILLAVAAMCCSSCAQYPARPKPQLAPPGIVIAHSPASSRVYLGSPALAILPDGAYVVAHDTFGAGSEQNTEMLYVSRDRGHSWRKLGELHGQYWSSLFVEGQALYIMGTSGFSGVPVIRRSLDGGKTWSVPRDADSGVLANGGRYFTAPVPVVIAKGRIWRTMESVEQTGIWPFMMSAPVDSDLLRADNWTFSNRLAPNPGWLDGKFGGWLEGNAVAKPDGSVVNVLRVYYNALPERAAIVTVNANGTMARFDVPAGFVDMPGGGKKFTIRFDPRTKLYWSLSNVVTPLYRGNNYERARNVVALISSPDLVHWTLGRTVLSHPDWNRHGFQYVDWQFDGNDIVAVARTSFDDPEGGAHSQHDANFVTFHRIARFRDSGTAE